MFNYFLIGILLEKERDLIDRLNNCRLKWNKISFQIFLIERDQQAAQQIVQ